MRTLKFLLTALGALASLQGLAQEELDVSISCNYYGEKLEAQLYGFASDQEAQAAVARIMKYTGLPQNFEILASNVSNAAATIRREDTTRLILYNQTFMERVRQTTQTDWAASSILAHEIGHHLAGHTLKNDGSRPRTELEADQFSGHVLYKMGAALKEAQTAMETVAGEAGSETHPPKSARLAAIANGWTAARDQTAGPPKEEKPAKDVVESEPEEVDEEEPEDEVVLAEKRPTGTGYCRFYDGSVSYVKANDEIVMYYLNQQITVGTRQESDNPKFVWLYVIESQMDPWTKMYLNSIGITSTVTYGVDRNGIIWQTTLWGDMQIGQFYED